jgi:hypothetical protein
MLRNMSARTYQGWLRYAAVEPFDEQRADLRAGIVASVIANAFGGKKGGRLFTPSDFMPFSEKPPSRRRSTDEMFQKVRVLNKLMGGAFVDKREPREVA